MSAKLNIKSSSRISLNKDGYRAELVAIVSAVAGSIDAVLKNAIDDGQLPSYGDPHPVMTEITLNNLTCSPIGGGKYKVIMSYYKDTAIATGSASAKVTISATTATEAATTDVNGDTLETKFSGFPLSGVPGTVYNGYIWGDVQVDRPRLNIAFEYTATSVPKSDINNYLGNINSVAWNGYAIGTILCTAIDVTERGQSYNVRYTFEYNPDGWNFTGIVDFCTLPLSAHATAPDASLDLNTGQRNFILYNSVDFTPLGFVI